MPKRTATINHPSSSTKKEDNKAEQETVEEEKLSLSNLKDLVYLGSCQKMVKLGGYNFKMKTLTAAEQKSLLSRIMNSQEAGGLLDAKPVTLAFSVLEINGVPTHEIYDGDEDLSDIDRAINLFSEMQVSVIDALFKHYESLLETSTKKFDVEDLKA
tara:strand:+ start:1051 stop:1521 length:471 start_codon:yes stop_codon:yes gene_type:complete